MCRVTLGCLSKKQRYLRMHISLPGVLSSNERITLWTATKTQTHSNKHYSGTRAQGRSALVNHSMLAAITIVFFWPCLRCSALPCPRKLVVSGIPFVNVRYSPWNPVASTPSQKINSRGCIRRQRCAFFLGTVCLERENTSARTITGPTLIDIYIYIKID